MLRSLLALVALIAIPALADEPAKPKDAPRPFEPRSAPGAGQAYLAKTVGDWDVVKTFHPREGEPRKTTGRCRQTMVHDGRFLQSEFRFDGGERAGEGVGLIGFEPESGLFTSVWTDSRQTRMSIRRSKEPFDGTKIVLYGVSLEPIPARPETSKTISRLEDDGKRLIHTQYTVAPDGAERVIMDLVMTRRAAPAAGETIPSERASEHVGKAVTVAMTVRASKDSEHRKCWFLDSESDFHDEKNLAVLISHEHAESFRKAGVADPATTYRGRAITVRGTIVREDGQTRIHVSRPEDIQPGGTATR